MMITCIFENGKKAGLRHAVVHPLVLKGNQILLIRRAKQLLEGGKWGFPGGYMDRDETLETCVKREVKEETGWEVNRIKLISIMDSPHRPNIADRQDVAFNFTCKAVKKTGESDWEVTEQRWFDLDTLPPKKEIAFDHFQVIRSYIKDKKGTKGVTIISKSEMNNKF
jgi:8-oxo-dGTP diphosphatase